MFPRQAGNDALGVTTTTFVNVALTVFVVVVVTYKNDIRVFVGVGSVVTTVEMPLNTVTGGNVMVAVVETAVDSVVNMGLAVNVSVAFTGTVPLTVMVGTSGARLWS